MRMKNIKVLYIPLLVVLLSLNPVSAWANDGYLKRVNITLNNTDNSDTLTDHQVGINVTYDSNMETDFREILFYDDDDSTLIDFWLHKKVDSSWAMFWIEVPQIDASSNDTIYMYYDNSTSTSQSNGTATFLFGIFQDLEDGSIGVDASDWYQCFGWTTVMSFDVQNDSGNKVMELIGSGGGNGGCGYYNSSQKINVTSDPYIFEADFNTTSAQKRLGFITEIDDSGLRDGYNYEFYGSGGVFRRIVNGAFTNLLTPTNISFSQNVWHDLRFDRFRNSTHNSANMYINGTQQFTYDDSNLFNEHGYIGFFLESGDTTYYDDVRIRRYTNPEPTIIMGIEEVNLPIGCDYLLTSCDNVNVSDSVYCLDNSISDASIDCFEVTANDTEFDCRNYIIDGDKGSNDKAFDVYGFNFTAHDCQITDYDYWSYINNDAHNWTFDNITYVSDMGSSTNGNEVYDADDGIIIDSDFDCGIDGFCFFGGSETDNYQINDSSFIGRVNDGTSPNDDSNHQFYNNQMTYLKANSRDIVVEGGSIDVYVLDTDSDGITTGYFRNTNMTGFNRSVTWETSKSNFTYEHTNDVRIISEPNVTGSFEIGRYLQSINETYLLWNDTGNVVMNYTLSGLNASSNFEVRDNDVSTYNLTTDSGGVLELFQIDLASEHEIEVLEFTPPTTTTTTLPPANYTSYYCQDNWLITNVTDVTGNTSSEVLSYVDCDYNCSSYLGRSRCNPEPFIRWILFGIILLALVWFVKTIILKNMYD